MASLRQADELDLAQAMGLATAKPGDEAAKETNIVEVEGKGYNLKTPVSDRVVKEASKSV